MKHPLTPSPPTLTPERIAELKRLLVLAEDTDAALENLLTEDEETIAMAGEDNDDAEDALRDALRDSAPALLSAASRLAEVTAAARWIPVGERLPAWRTNVLVLSGGAHVVADISGYYDRECTVPHWRDDDMDTVIDVTHWMPLPEPPARPLPEPDR